jgi:hypothetical protein
MSTQLPDLLGELVHPGRQTLGAIRKQSDSVSLWRETANKGTRGLPRGCPPGGPGLWIRTVFFRPYTETC